MRSTVAAGLMAATIGVSGCGAELDGPPQTWASAVAWLDDDRLVAIAEPEPGDASYGFGLDDGWWPYLIDADDLARTELAAGSPDCLPYDGVQVQVGMVLLSGSCGTMSRDRQFTVALDPVSEGTRVVASWNLSDRPPYAQEQSVWTSWTSPEGDGWLSYSTDCSSISEIVDGRLVPLDIDMPAGESVSVGTSGEISCWTDITTADIATASDGTVAFVATSGLTEDGRASAWSIYRYDPDTDRFTEHPVDGPRPSALTWCGADQLLFTVGETSLDSHSPGPSATERHGLWRLNPEPEHLSGGNIRDLACSPSGDRVATLDHDPRSNLTIVDLS